MSLKLYIVRNRIKYACGHEKYNFKILTCQPNESNGCPFCKRCPNKWELCKLCKFYSYIDNPKCKYSFREAGADKILIYDYKDLENFKVRNYSDYLTVFTFTGNNNNKSYNKYNYDIYYYDDYDDYDDYGDYDYDYDDFDDLNDYKNFVIHAEKVIKFQSELLKKYGEKSEFFYGVICQSDYIKWENVREGDIVTVNFIFCDSLIEYEKIECQSCEEKREQELEDRYEQRLYLESFYRDSNDPVLFDEELALYEYLVSHDDGSYYNKSYYKIQGETEYEIGRDYYLKGDYNKAYEYFKKAADLGLSQAMITMGELYMNGEGVKQDFKKAYEWFRRAADLGEEFAMYALGYLYLEGKGTRQDYGKAYEWFKKVADLENKDAMNAIGWLYQSGYGVEQDYEKAYEWYRKAIEYKEKLEDSFWNKFVFKLK